MAKITVTQAKKFICQGASKQLKDGALRYYFFRFKDYERSEIYEFFTTDIKDCTLGFDSTPDQVHAEGVRHLQTLERKSATPVYVTQSIDELSGKSANDLSS